MIFVLFSIDPVMKEADWIYDTNCACRKKSNSSTQVIRSHRLSLGFNCCVVFSLTSMKVNVIDHDDKAVGVTVTGHQFGFYTKCHIGGQEPLMLIDSLKEWDCGERRKHHKMILTTVFKDCSALCGVYNTGL